MEGDIKTENQSPVKNSVQPEQPSIVLGVTKPKRKIKWPLVVVIILAILLIVGVSGYVAFLIARNVHKPIVMGCDVVITCSDGTQVMGCGGNPCGKHSISDPTADWKTYTNPSDTFSFKYPPDLSLKQLNPNEVDGKLKITYGELEFATVVSQTTPFPIPEMGKVYSAVWPTTPLTDVQHSQSQIANIPTEIYDISCGADCGRELVRFSHGGINYEMRFQTTGAGLYDIEQQILSSFKFTPPAGGQNQTVDISTWKTHTNSQYGISFKYPMSFKKCCAISISPNEGTPKNSIVKLITLGEVGENQLGSDSNFNGLVVGIDTNLTGESFPDYFNEQKQEWQNVTKQDSKESDIKVGILSGKMLQNYSPFGGEILYFPFPNSQTVLVIGKTEASENSFKDFNPILSTFKFTK